MKIEVDPNSFGFCPYCGRATVNCEITLLNGKSLMVEVCPTDIVGWETEHNGE